jgi:hypothetical protein
VFGIGVVEKQAVPGRRSLGIHVGVSIQGSQDICSMLTVLSSSLRPANTASLRLNSNQPFDTAPKSTLAPFRKLLRELEPIISSFVPDRSRLFKCLGV